MAIGHVRYSTTGGGSWENAQPVWRDDGREVALAHNGNLTNAVELWAELKERGIDFRGTSDSEIIAALLSSHGGKLIEDAVQEVMPRLEGAYSTVVMTKHAIVAFRDPHGIRPLSLGRLDDRFVVASESCAFDIIGAELMREVHPGEMVSPDRARAGDAPGGQGRAQGDLRLRAHLLLPPRQPPRGQGAAAGARQDGRDALARVAGRSRPGDRGAGLRQPGRGGVRARLGAAARRRPDQEPLRRPHLHPARPGAAQARPAAEVQPAAGDRRRAADRRRRRLDRARQHHPPDRRHAARRRRQGGPPADLGAADPQPLPLRRRHVDPRGDDRPQAHRSSEIAEELDADSLAYLSMDGVYEAIGGGPEDHCDACFSGHYPLGDPDDANGKFALEDIAVVPSAS